MPTGIGRRINAERLAVLSWGRAILLQLAHPLVAAGVLGHSSFRSGPATAVVRLHSTIRAMLSLTFGDAAEHVHTIDAIRTIHRRVNGRLREAVGPFPEGTRYSAEDPDLVLWVHLTLIESVVLFYDDLISPLDTATRDAYCDEARDVALALGARDEAIPRTWGDLIAALDGVYRSGVIAVGPDARLAARALLRPRLTSLAWPLARVYRTLTIGTLPEDLRQQYGFDWTGRDEQRLDRTVRRLRALRRRAPRALAWWAAARRPQ